MIEISILVPEIATVVALVNFLLVFINFRYKPWKFKGWIITAMFFWVPWAGFTVLMRTAATNRLALYYLQASFLSSYISLYALYRFHRSLVLKPNDGRFTTFGLAIFMGINIGLGINNQYLGVIRTNNGNYWTDQFSPQLYVPHVVFALMIGILTYQALRKLDAFSLFYASENKNNPFHLLIGASIVAIVGILLVTFFLQSNQQDATPFLILSIFITSFLGMIYGINPISKILAPQRLWTFFIIGKSGLPIFEYHFSPDENLGELALVSGALNASSLTIMDYLKTGEPLQMVDLDERVIFLAHRDDLTFALIADHSSEQLHIVLEDTVNKIMKHPEFRKYLPGKGHGKYDFTREILVEIFEARR